MSNSVPFSFSVRACVSMISSEVKLSSASVSEGNYQCNCIIEDVIIKPFYRRDFTEKISIKERGRPTPQLPSLSVLCKDRNREYTRHFCATNYVKHKWLTGCPNLNKLFCWPCLLFSNENTVWSKEGFSNIAALAFSVNRHEKTKSHISSAFALCNFGNSRIDLQLDTQKSLGISKHNEIVKRNRDILVRLIDVICYLGKQELALRGHDESENSLNKGNYVETLTLLGHYDHLLDEHLKNSTVFRGTSPAIQNDLIESVSGVMIAAIKEEIMSVSFVSILLDECSDVINKSQLSTVLRYVDKSGDVQERFIGFTDVSSDRSAEALYSHVLSVVNDFQLQGKLVAQTYDGAAVMSGRLGGLQAKVRETFPQALFIHCYSHVLNLVLQQSATSIKECRIFFQSLSGLANFFFKVQ